MMVVIRSRLLCAGLGVLVLAGCASMRVDGPARRAGTNATTNPIATKSSTPRWGCDGDGSGFAASRAVEGHGAASPLAAAREFVRHPEVPGFGTPASVWTVTARGQGEATLVAGRVSLHASQPGDRTWWIDSGQRCG